jgi:hypothetical protein
MEGYQAAKEDGQQSVLYSDASVDRVQPNTAATLGQQRLAADGSMFSAWLEARAANNPRLQAMLVRRFSPEYRTAFVAWLETEPFTNPNAPPGPGYLPEYRNPQMEQATKLNEKAGTEARHTAEEYVRATVLFALVLFLVAGGSAVQATRRPHRDHRDRLRVVHLRPPRRLHPATAVSDP